MKRSNLQAPYVGAKGEIVPPLPYICACESTKPYQECKYLSINVQLGYFKPTEKKDIIHRLSPLPGYLCMYEMIQRKDLDLISLAGLAHGVETIFSLK